MDIRLAAFASELTKLAEAQKTQRQSYARQVALAAPAAVATAAAKIPEGALEQAIESAVVKGRPSGMRAALARGVSKSTGRLAVGLATTPIFLSGLKDIKESKTPEQKRKGYAKVLGSGMVFSAGKGAVENVLEPAMKGKAINPKALRKVVGGRTALGLLGATLTARSIAKSMRAPKKGKKKKRRSSVGPAATGAALGALEGTFDSLGRHGMKALKSSAGRRKVVGPVLGKAVAGAVGAMALTEVARKVLAPSKKNPRVRRWQRVDKKTKTAAAAPAFGEQPEMYDQVRSWAKDKNEVDIYDFYKDIVANGMGERTPSRRAATYALTDELEQRGHKMPPTKQREQVTGKVKAPGMADTAAVVAVASTPALAMAAAANLSPDDRDRVLSDALDRQFIQGRMERVESAFGGEMYERVPVEGLFGKPVPGQVRERIHLPKKGQELPGVVAHELGHSTSGAIRALAGTELSHKVFQAGRAAALILPILAVEGASGKSFATPEELESRANLIRNVGIVAGMAQAPVLAEEAIANVKAVQLLQQAGASRGEAVRKVLKHAGPGFSTYAVPALLPFLVAGHLRRKAKKGRKRERGIVERSRRDR